MWCIVLSLQGDVVHWLACSLYAACRKGSTPTVGKGLMEGNCVSLTRILRSSKLRSVAVYSATTDEAHCSVNYDVIPLLTFVHLI